MKEKAEMTPVEELIACGWLKNPSDKMQDKAEKQLTAVEWLADEIIMLEEKLRLEEININDFMDAKDELVNKALEMEKEQIEMAFFKGKTFGMNLPDGLTAEEYYNETFKSE